MKSSQNYTHKKFESIDSTNSYILQNINLLDYFTVISAESQTHGRGRHNRSWICTPGKDVAFSLLLPWGSIGHEQWNSITLIMGYALITALESVCFSAQIKWPNDIVYRDKKIAGVLCESAVRNNQWACIVGIGINVNSTADDLKSIHIPTTSLFQILGEYTPRDFIVDRVVCTCIEFLDVFKEKGFIFFKNSIQSRLAYMDKKVICCDLPNQYAGIIKGITNYGELITADSFGEERIFRGSAISLDACTYNV